MLNFISEDDVDLELPTVLGPSLLTDTDEMEETGFTHVHKKSIMDGMRPKLMGGIRSPRRRSPPRDVASPSLPNNCNDQSSCQQVIVIPEGIAFQGIGMSNKIVIERMKSDPQYEQKAMLNLKTPATLSPSSFSSSHISERYISPRIKNPRLRLSKLYRQQSPNEKNSLEVLSPREELQMKVREYRLSEMSIQKNMRTEGKKVALVPDGSRGSNSPEQSGYYLNPDASSFRFRMHESRSIESSRKNTVTLLKADMSGLEREGCKEEGDNMRIDTNIDCEEMLKSCSPFMAFVKRQSEKKEKALRNGLRLHVVPPVESQEATQQLFSTPYSTATRIQFMSNLSRTTAICSTPIRKGSAIVY